MRSYHWFCWVDRKTCIVVRQTKAVHLSLLQFSIFNALHSVRPHEGKKLNARHLADIVYNGVRNPSTEKTLHVCVSKMNKKLAHVGLKVRGVARKQNSFYQIVLL